MAGGSTTIIIVHGSEAVRSQLTRLLRREGFSVWNAETGVAGLALPFSDASVVLIGDPLPDMSGLQVCRMLKLRSRGTGSPLVCLLSRTQTYPDPDEEHAPEAILEEPISESETVYLVRSLSRLSERAIQRRARDSQWQTALDNVSDAFCAVDSDGVIRWCNEALAHFVGQPKATLVGRPFRELESRSLPHECRLVLSQTLATRSVTCVEAKAKERWLSIQAIPARDEHGELIGCVLRASDTTQAHEGQERAQRAESDIQRQSNRIEQLEGEVRLLQKLGDEPTAGVTAQLFGAGPLRVVLPDVFQELVGVYGTLLDQALQQHDYRVNHHVSDGLNRLGERLGFLRAGPRDVVELHSAALKAKREQVKAAKLAAYVQEGRLLILELMGHLAGYYRKFYSPGHSTRHPKETPSAGGKGHA